MELTELIAPAGVLLDVRARDKAHLITDLSRIAAGQTPSVPPAAIEAALLARERLGSTGLGAGFALPHARVEGLARFVGLFVRLSRPIEFDAIDGRPVDLLFLLLIPGRRHRTMSGPWRRYRGGSATAVSRAACARRRTRRWRMAC